MGDGTLECEDLAHTIQMVDLFINESDILIQMCEQIKANKKLGLYDGAYRAVELAFAQKNKK